MGVMIGRRAYPTAQVLLSGVPLYKIPRFVDVGWYDTRIHPETGAFAVIREDGPLEELAGEVLRVTCGRRSTFVYCAGSADVPTDLALYRRAYLDLMLLSREAVPCIVEVIR